MPVVKSFLLGRGLTLSPEKTKITHIQDGFNFLGFNIRKYKDKLLIKPSKNSIKSFLKNIRQDIKSNHTAKAENLIRLLNPKIRGWANYFRHVVAKEVYGYVDHHIFLTILKWVKRRHPSKPSKWCKSKYFCHNQGRDWNFFAHIKENNSKRTIQLVKASDIKIVRHIKVKADANPFDIDYNTYFQTRKLRQWKISNSHHKEALPNAAGLERNSFIKARDGMIKVAKKYLVWENALRVDRW